MNLYSLYIIGNLSLEHVFITYNFVGILPGHQALCD